jgi:L-iditol 2-dehydrogenase
MKAAVFYEPEQIQLEDVPDPTAGDDEVIVRVRACGFCGSDIEYYYGKSPLGTPDGKGPLVLGHELCGEVVEAGKLAAATGSPRATASRSTPSRAATPATCAARARSRSARTCP